MSMMDRAEDGAIRGVIRGFLWLALLAIRLVWATLRSLWNLPRNIRLVWREIRFGPKRCEICEADLGGFDYCGVCGSLQDVPGAEGVRMTLEESISVPKPKIPLAYYDWARRLSFAAATISIALIFAFSSFMYVLFLLFPQTSGVTDGVTLGRAIGTLLLYCANAAVFCAPALYFMAHRWRIPFSLKSALLWSLVAVIFALISGQSTASMGWLMQGLNFVMLLCLGITVVLVLLQVIYPYLLVNQAKRWDEFFVSSLSQIGYAGRPGGQLSLSSLDPKLVEIGQLGEQQTAEAARGSLESKSILFNSIMDKSAGGLGDLDHAVVVGNQLILLDSKRWRSAYYQVSQGNVLRDGEPFEGGNISLSQWANHYRRVFGPEIQVRGFVILTNPAAIIEGNPMLSPDVELVSLPDFAKRLESIRDANTALPNAQVVRYFSNLLASDSAAINSAQMELTPLDSYLTSKNLKQDLRNLFRRFTEPPQL
jgi:hypothetical protein